MGSGGSRYAARRRGWWLVGGLVLLVLLAAGAARAWHWHTHPTVFPGAGNMWSGPLGDGQDLMTVGLTNSEPGEGRTVVIRSVAPRVRKNTAGATYEFYVCTISGQEQVQLGIVSGQRNFDRYCPDAERVREGTELHTGGSPGQQLVMVVRMPRPGRPLTTGVELTYSDGAQRGTQLIGPRVRVTRGRGGSPRGSSRRGPRPARRARSGRRPARLRRPGRAGRATPRRRSAASRGGAARR